MEQEVVSFFLIVVLCLVACNEQRLCQRTEMLLYPLIRLAIVTEEGRHPDLRSRPSNVVWTDGQVAEGCLRGRPGGRPGGASLLALRAAAAALLFANAFLFCSRTLCAWHWCEDESSSLEAKSLPRSSFPVRQKRLSAVPI